MTLKRLESDDLHRWIRDGTDRLLHYEDPDWCGIFVSHCIPPIFAAYCKLFHPVFVDTSAPAGAGSWAAADDRPKTYGHLVSVSTNYGPRGRRVRWRELADKYGLQLSAEFNEESLKRVFPDKSWPRSLLGPDEGYLDTPTCIRLIEILRPFTLGKLCYFHYDLIATRWKESEVTFSGNLEDVLNCRDDEDVLGSPTYWWPHDRTWLLCTDWDLKFTLIGGPSELIEQLIHDDELECIQVTSKTRIDIDADQLNLGKGI